ncbi:MAG: tripartite tricarboxylate transporter TctB family protein [Pseudomonadota bacterium]
MSTHDPAVSAEHAIAGDDDDEASPPRSDLKDAIGWMVFGIAVLVGSITMDRLAAQNINPVTAPGLLPGLLGIAMVLLGAVMALRSVRAGALVQPLPAPTARRREERKRVWIAVALCAGYGMVLVGHGIPFWLASTVYVAASILIFQRISPDPAERRLDAKSWAKALVIAVLASAVTWAAFEKLFLVRLP